MFGTIAIAIAKAQLFENWTIWNPTFKSYGFQMFPDFKWLDFRFPLYSDDSTYVKAILKQS